MRGTVLWCVDHNPTKLDEAGLYTMIKFRYLFNGVHHDGFARRFSVKESFRYLVLLNDGSSLILAKTDIRSPGHQVIWTQIPKNNETNQDNDFIQALGSGLESGELI